MKNTNHFINTRAKKIYTLGLKGVKGIWKIYFWSMIGILILCLPFMLWAILKLLGGTFVDAFYMERYCTYSNTVKEIGACDILGNCSVILENQQVGTISKPVKGQNVCIKYEWIESKQPSFNNLYNFTLGRLFFQQEFRLKQ